MINRWYFGPPSQTIPELLRDLGHRPWPATGIGQHNLPFLNSSRGLSSAPDPYARSSWYLRLELLLSPADTYQLCGCLWWGRMQCSCSVGPVTKQDGLGGVGLIQVPLEPLSILTRPRNESTHQLRFTTIHTLLGVIASRPSNGHSQNVTRSTKFHDGLEGVFDAAEGIVLFFNHLYCLL